VIDFGCKHDYRKRYIGPGEIVAIISVFKEKEYPATAETIGATIYTVSRILSAWEKKGWIKSRREQIIVCDPHSLVLLSEHP
jgi:CRP-like cAMP-binding protein